MSSSIEVFDNFGLRGIYPEQINEDLAWRVGFAAAQFFRSNLKGYDRGQASTNRVVIGRDTRPASESLAKALSEGIATSGVECIDIGPCDTPMLSFAVNHFGACGGVQVTASRSSIDYNGLKFTGYKAKSVEMDSGLAEIQRIATRLSRMGDNALITTPQQVDIWKEYREHVGKFLTISRMMKVVADASNCVGAKMIETIFCPEAIEITRLNFEFDGSLAHKSDPLDSASLSQVCKAVVETEAHFGFCLDGGADRCVFIDELGRIVPPDLMTALLAKHMLADNPGALIVYDHRCSRSVGEAILGAGGVARAERTGGVKKALIQGQGLFAGGVDGKYYFRDNFNCESAAIAIALVIRLLSSQDRPMSELIAPLARYSRSGEIGFATDMPADAIERLTQALDGAKITALDGKTLSFDSWWCNIRPGRQNRSLRLNLEAKTPAEMNEKLNLVKNILHLEEI